MLGEIIDQYLDPDRSKAALSSSGWLGEATTSPLARAAHTLGGASANVGAMALAAVCAEIEALRPAMPNSTVQPALIERFDAEFARVRDALTLVAAGS